MFIKTLSANAGSNILALSAKFRWAYLIKSYRAILTLEISSALTIAIEFISVLTLPILSKSFLNYLLFFLSVQK